MGLLTAVNLLLIGLLSGLGVGAGLCGLLLGGRCRGLAAQARYAQACAEAATRAARAGWSVTR